jgi:hypothetical protein
MRIVLAVVLTQAALAHADEGAIVLARAQLVTPRPELDDDLPDLDLMLHPEAAEDDPDAAFVPRWYGRTLIVSELASSAVWLTGKSTDSTSLADLGLAGMILSAPLVHGLRGHWARAGVGLLVRVGGSLLGSQAAGALGGDGWRRAGALTGYLGAVAFDGLYLCRDWVTSEAPTSELSLAVGWSGRF